MTKALPFTPASITALRSGTISDKQNPGLVAVATPSGKTVFRYCRRVPSTGRIHKSTFGPFPAFSIMEAREWAQGINAMIDRKIDPVVAKEAEKVATITVAEAHAIYMEHVGRGLHRDRQVTVKPRTILDKRNIFRADVAPKLGERALASVSADDLYDLIEEKGESAPVRANRLAAELKVFFKFCGSRRARKLIGLTADPASSLDAHTFEESKRRRFLSEYEIELLFKALATEKRGIFRPWLLMLLTATRKSEALEASTSEYSRGIWTLPANRVKNGEMLMLPLSRWGRSIFEGVNTPLLFPSSRIEGAASSDQAEDAARCGWYKVRDRVLAKMVEIAGHPVEKFGYHDLRRTFRSNTKPLKIDKDVAERVLNHKPVGLVDTYDQHDYVDERGAALAVWEAHLIGIARRVGVADALEVPG